MCAVWRISGEESTDGGCAVVTLFAVTADPALLPDPHAAYAAVRGRPEGQLYRVDAIRLVDRLAPAPLGLTLLDAVHDQRQRGVVTPQALGLQVAPTAHRPRS
jgi:hypothetical protein